MADSSIAADAEALAAEAAPRKRHHWSDWVGFIAFGGTLLWGATKSSGISIFGLPIFVLEFLKAASFLLRGPAKRTLVGLGPKLAAYGTTYLVPAFLLMAGRWFPKLTRPSSSPELRTVGWILGIMALVLAIRPLWSLRRSFSIEPVARELITTGPYAWARHPIYTTYLVAYLGLWISTPRLVLTLVLLAWFVLLLRRIRFEERVLEAAYPDYAAYRQRVGMFVPRLRRQ